MTRNLLSGRISGSSLISFGDNQIVQFENDAADCLGIPTDTILTNPIWGIDEDGNITHWTNNDGATATYGIPRIKDTETYGGAGLRIWDATNSREVYLVVRDEKFIIQEADSGDVGDVDATGVNWHEKLSFPLAAAAGQNLDFDLTGQASKYLIVKSDASGIDFADSEALAVPSCQVQTDTPQNVGAASSVVIDFDDPADWELNGTDLWQAAYPAGIQVPVSGVYLIQVYVKWDLSTSGYVSATVRGRAGGAAEPPNFTTDLLVDQRIVGSGDYLHSFSGIVDLSANVFVGLQVYNGTVSSDSVEEATLAVSLVATPAS